MVARGRDAHLSRMEIMNTPQQNADLILAKYHEIGEAKREELIAEHADWLIALDGVSVVAISRQVEEAIRLVYDRAFIDGVGCGMDAARLATHIRDFQ